MNEIDTRLPLVPGIFLQAIFWEKFLSNGLCVLFGELKDFGSAWLCPQSLHTALLLCSNHKTCLVLSVAIKLVIPNKMHAPNQMCSCTPDLGNLPCLQVLLRVRPIKKTSIKREFRLNHRMRIIPLVPNGLNAKLNKFSSIIHVLCKEQTMPFLYQPDAAPLGY